jgi:hypothetical protein
VGLTKTACSPVLSRAARKEASMYIGVSLLGLILLIVLLVILL